MVCHIFYDRAAVAYLLLKLVTLWTLVGPRSASGVLLYTKLAEVRSRTVRKVPYQPTNLPGQLELSADLHPPKECVKEGTNQPTLLGECGT